MDERLVVIILISFYIALTSAVEDTHEESKIIQDDYSSIELATPTVSEEERSPRIRDDGIVDLDDIIRSSEFNNMYYPETIQVRRFAEPMKDDAYDDIYKIAKLNTQSKDAIKDKDKSAKEEKKIGREIEKNAKKEDKIGRKEEKSGIKEDKSGSKEDNNGTNEDRIVPEMNVNEETTNKEQNNNNDEQNDTTRKETTTSGSEQYTTASSLVEDRSTSTYDLETKASKTADSIQEKSDDSPKRSLNTRDSIPDDMDDLLYPYLLEKFNKDYDDVSYDRSQYSESHGVNYDSDSSPYDSSESKSSRRTFDPSTTPGIDESKQEQLEMPRLTSDGITTPSPLFGSANRSPQMFQPVINRPIPFMNNLYQLPYSNLPSQSSQFQRFNNFQQFPNARRNFQGPFISPTVSRNSNHRNPDSNEYPYTSSTPAPTIRTVQPINLRPFPSPPFNKPQFTSPPFNPPQLTSPPSYPPQFTSPPFNKPKFNPSQLTSPPLNPPLFISPSYNPPQFNSPPFNKPEYKQLQFTPPPSNPPINPVFAKLTQASNNPRQMPYFINFNLPFLHPSNVPNHVHRDINFHPNYLPRFKRLSVSIVGL